MSRFLASALVVLTSVSAFAAILTADPQGAADVADVSAEPQNEVAAALEQKGYQVASRIAYKETLIRDLIAGRTTLARVSDEFLRLNEEEPSALLVIQTSYPGSGDEEKSTLNVLDFVRFQRLPAEENARVFQRLNREYADRFGHAPLLKESPNY